MDEVRKALEERLGRRISHEEENTIALSTRADKQAVDPIALRKEWLSRADRVGLDVGSCFDRADRARPFEHLPEGLTNQLFADLVDPDTGVCATTNTFDRGDVMKAITDWSINEDDARGQDPRPTRGGRAADGPVLCIESRGGDRPGERDPSP